MKLVWLVALVALASFTSALLAGESTEHWYFLNSSSNLTRPGGDVSTYIYNATAPSAAEPNTTVAVACAASSNCTMTAFYASLGNPGLHYNATTQSFNVSMWASVTPIAPVVYLWWNATAYYPNGTTAWTQSGYASKQLVSTTMALKQMNVTVSQPLWWNGTVKIQVMMENNDAGSRTVTTVFGGNTGSSFYPFWATKCGVGSGDLVVAANTTIICGNTTATLAQDKNVSVLAGSAYAYNGNFTLSNAALRLQPSGDSYPGSANVTIEGNFYAWKNSTLTAYVVLVGTPKNYTFLAAGSANFKMDNSTISYAGINDAYGTFYNYARFENTVGTQINGSNVQASLRLSGVDSFTVTHSCIGNASSRHGVSSSDSSNLVFYRNEFYGSEDMSLLSSTRDNHVNFTENRVYGYAELYLASASQLAEFKNNTGNIPALAYLSDYVNNTYFYDNDFTVASGVTLVYTYNDIQNIRVERNRFRNSTNVRLQWLLYVPAGAHVNDTVISNNTFDMGAGEDSNLVVEFVAGSFGDHVSIAYNDFKGGFNSSGFLFAGRQDFLNVSYNKGLNYTLTSSMPSDFKTPIQIHNSYNGTIIGNEIRGSSSTAFKNNYDCIQFYAYANQYNEVSFNNVSNCRNGIYFYGVTRGMNYNNASYNHVSSTVQACIITLDGRYNTLSYNNVSGCGTWGGMSDFGYGWSSGNNLSYNRVETSYRGVIFYGAKNGFGAGNYIKNALVRGLDLTNANNISISGTTIDGGGASLLPLVLSNNHDTTINDSAIINLAGYRIVCQSGEMDAYNFTFDKSSVIYATAYGTNNVTVYWWVWANVTLADGTPIDAALVNVKDVDGANVYSGYTDATGLTPKLAVKEYYQNETTTVNFTPHNVSASKGTRENSTLASVSYSQIVWLILSSDVPSSMANLLLNGTDADRAYVFGETTNATGSCAGGVLVLTRNGTVIGNPDEEELGLGSWNFTVTCVGDGVTFTTTWEQHDAQVTLPSGGFAFILRAKINGASIAQSSGDVYATLLVTRTYRLTAGDTVACYLYNQGSSNATLSAGNENAYISVVRNH